MSVHPNYPVPRNFALNDLRIPRRPWGFGPYGYGLGLGYPFFGGFLGGLTAGALLRPSYFYNPYPFYGGYWF